MLVEFKSNLTDICALSNVLFDHWLMFSCSVQSADLVDENFPQLRLGHFDLLKFAMGYNIIKKFS